MTHFYRTVLGTITLMSQQMDSFMTLESFDLVK